MHQSTRPDLFILYHKRRAQMERAKGLSHLVPAFVLLSGLLGVLTGSEPFTLLLGLEVLVGVAYIVLLVRELRHVQQHPTHHEKVAWLELASASILALEGYHIWHRHHEKALQTGQERLHILPWLYGVLAVWYVAMAFGMGKLHERRHLHLHPEGVSGRLHPFGRKFRYAWADIVRVEPQGEADVLLHHADGREQRLSFAAMFDGPAHRDRLVAHFAQRSRS